MGDTPRRKRKKKLRPVIKITSDHLSAAGLVCDALILVLLFVWFVIDMFILLRSVFTT